MIKKIAIYLDTQRDETYTPTLLSIQLGITEDDLQLFKTFQLHEPQGWYAVSLKTEKQPVEVFILRLLVLENHGGGKDARIRGVRVTGMAS